MPDLTNRSDYENRMASELAKFGRVEMAALAAELGQPPSAMRVPDSWWESHRERLAGVLAAVFVDVYLDAARTLQAEQPGDATDWALITAEAADWSREQAGKLAGDLTTNTRTALTSLLLLAGTVTADDFERRVRGLFGPTRAATIAITETTRAVSAAERRTMKLIALALAVAAPVAIHHTAADERVCPYCWPRNDRPITDGIFPPLHPRCRCWVEWRLE